MLAYRLRRSDRCLNAGVALTVGNGSNLCKILGVSDKTGVFLLALGEDLAAHDSPLFLLSPLNTRTFAELHSQDTG